MTDVTPEGPVMGWSGVMMVLNRWAGELDRRIIREADWPTLPRTFGLNHDSTEAVGSVDHMELRSEDGVDFVWGHGRFSATDEGIKAAMQLEEQVLRTVSVELRDGVVVQSPVYDDAGLEVGVATDWQKATIGSVAFERQPAHAGAVIMSDPLAAMFDPGDFPVDPGLGTLEADDINLEPVEDEDEYAGILEAVDDLRLEVDTFRAAGAGPYAYPARMFSRLDYHGPTRLTISPEGEVTGHVAVWGKAHRAGNGWLAAPCGDLSDWLVGSTLLDNGEVIRTGVIVSDGLHAPAHPKGATSREMTRLIESTATQVITANAWEDEWGTAVHGSTLPGVTPDQATRAMAGCPSLDQRDFGDGRGFVTCGVLMVNTCGFTPGDAVVSVENGEPVRRLVASAGVPDCGCGEPTACSCGTIPVHRDVMDELKKDAVTLPPELARLVADARAAGAEPDPPPVVDLAALAAADRKMAEARLKAATAPKPKR